MSLALAYEPKPGTVAYRAIAHLETLPQGAELNSAQLAEALGVESAVIVPSLQPALIAGLLNRRQKDRNHTKSPFFWSLAHASTATESAANGSQKPDGGAAIPAARAGREHTPQGANRDASAGQSHGATGSASPAGRGSNAAPARGAAPASHTPEPGPQQVLKATAARPDATERGAPDNASPVGGPTGAGQPAAAGPTRLLRCALWSDGVLQIQRRGDELVLLTRDEARELVDYLDAIGRPA